MTIKRSLPTPRSNVQIEPTSPLGIALRNARLSKQLPQRVLAEALVERCGGDPTNVRVSAFELGKKLPSDAELTVMAQMLGLSVVSLREKREASREHRAALQKEVYANQVASGAKPLKSKPAPAPVPKLVKVAKPAPASVPALAELVEQIDGIAPMPIDRDARKRWFHCVSELSRMAAS
jgi:transcriptional regulator with XRE-family HTH domain